MSKSIDLSRSVYELVQDYPELKDIMEELGFSEIKKPAMLNSVGRVMTLPRGAKMKNIPMEKIVMTLMQHGFTLAGDMPDTEAASAVESAAAPQAETRTEKLKGYLRRLGAGEDLEAVRADFKAAFEDVDASEIMHAEQELMKEGTPLSEVQKLCDLHSALFHGATRQERIVNAEKAVAASLKKERETPQEIYRSKEKREAALAALLENPAHPLTTFTRENENLSALLEQARTNPEGTLSKLREVSVHYAKKGDLLYPHLKVKYDITGPSDVMWTVDDEIRDELGALEKSADRDETWHERFAAVCKRAEEMIFKERNILFPICAAYFTPEEWHSVYRDSKDYADCLGVKGEVWLEAEASAPVALPKVEGEIVMPGGHLTVEQLTALLNILPIEITFIDADNINRFFNEGPKVFKRPGMAIDREVFSCHPPKVEPMVRAIIEDFRAGRRDKVPVWMEKGGRTMLVQYMAVRDSAGNYVGTVECVMDMEFAKEHFNK